MSVLPMRLLRDGANVRLLCEKSIFLRASRNSVNMLPSRLVGTMTNAGFHQPISEWVWRTRYRRNEPGIDATWQRVAKALAAVENSHASEWQERFYATQRGFQFLPGGRIVANAGINGSATLFNCFAAAGPDENIGDIFRSLRECMVTLSADGGVGTDFSQILPRGFAAPQGGSVSPGPVAWLALWDHACATATGLQVRPGAMMATLRDDHPDIESFVEAKRTPGALSRFNLSVLVSDALMRAVQEDTQWQLVFPVRDRSPKADAQVCERNWGQGLERCEIVHVLPARTLWTQLMRAAFDTSEPGVIFIDRIKARNNLYYCESIDTTNPCGEVPLPSNGACNLGALNLTQFVREPFSPDAHLDFARIASTTVIATRMLDNVYEVSSFPLEKQALVAHTSRRLGLGITGLADALVMLGLRYGSEASFELARRCMALICCTAYRTSTVHARERGSFPSYVQDRYCAGEFVKSLPNEVLAAIHKYGIRNSHLTAIAPAGAISLLANNVSSGIEPIFALKARRSVEGEDGASHEVEVDDYAWKLFRDLHGSRDDLPSAFVEMQDVDPIDQIRMQACLQQHVDNAISKTITVPDNMAFAAFCDLYRYAYRHNLKGTTVFRHASTVGTAIESCRHDSTQPC